MINRNLPWLSLAVVVFLLTCATLAPILAPYSPTEPEVLRALRPPGDPGHLLGTDTLGRDILSRLIYGAQSTVIVVFLALGASAVVGTLLGLVSGYAGGRTDAFIMRLVDIGLAFPSMLVALILAVFMGVGIVTVVVAVTATMWAKFARMIRGDVLAIRGRDYVTLARIAGVGAPRIIARHIVPNIANTLLIVSSLLVGQVILLEASLSFLGLGLPAGAPAWGIMVSEGRAFLTESWWLSLFPGLAIVLVVVAMNRLSDWIQKSLGVAETPDQL